MPLPYTLGSGLAEPNAADFARRIRAMLPDGYTRAEDGLFFYELEAWGKVFEYVHNMRRRLRSNMSARMTTELLDEWERAFSLASDAVRDDIARQQRLVAAESARGGATADRIATALAQIATSAPVDIVPITRADVVLAGMGATSEGAPLIFQLLATLSEADWNDNAIRRALATIIGRMVPARAWGQDGASVLDSMGTAEALWSGAAFLGRAYIALDAADGASDANELPPCRLRWYGPGSVLRARDLNALQDAVLRAACPGPASGLVDMGDGGAGQMTCAFSAQITTGTSAVIDNRDWRERLGLVVIRSVASATFDIRPGQSGDNNFAASAVPLYVRQVYWGLGANAPIASTDYVYTPVANVSIYADSSNGRLRIENQTGATISVAGVISAMAEEYDSHTNARRDGRLVAFTDGDDLTALSASFSTSLRDRTTCAKATGAGADGWGNYEGEGLRRLIGYVTNVAPGTSRLVDDSMDWRDRMIVATHSAIDLDKWTSIAYLAAGPIGATPLDTSDPTPDQLFAPHDTKLPASRAVSLGYSGVGSNATTVGPSVPLSPKARLWVDDSHGYLWITRDAEAAIKPCTFLLMLEATCALGQRTTPNAWSSAVGSDGTKVAPWKLNRAQDRALMGVASASHPIGKSRHEHARLSQLRLPSSLEHHGLELSQQRSSIGGARRHFAISVAAGVTSQLDATIDWRDRYVRLCASYSTAHDIRPGKTDDEQANWTTGVSAVAVARYTGASIPVGATGDKDVGYTLVIIAEASAGANDGITVYAHTDGSLRIRNGTGSTYYVNGWVDASVQLGVRS